MKKKDVKAFGHTMQVAYEFLKGLGSPRSLTVAMLVDEYLINSYSPDSFSKELDRIGFDINWYDQYSIDRFRDDYQATVLLSKLPPKDPDSHSLHDVAIKAFKESESRNAYLNSLWTNQSLVESRFAYHGHEATLANFRKEVRRVLGRCPSLSTLSRKGEWTSGSSVSTPKSMASQALKAEMGLTVTYPLAKALSQIGELSPLINTRDAWLLVPGNLVDTVLKNMKTNRTIAKEPDINSFFQRACGVVIRDRLQLEGIDLLCQENNQRACLMAMLRRSATIDERNASNSTLSFMVRDTFPSDWSDMFELLRSPFGSFNDRKAVRGHNAEWFEYHMLSSMGNGFTFELESVIFYCACLACGVDQDRVFIYGDDIIIPQEYVPEVTSFLALLGFETNTEKSFVSGAFFESCGVYAFNGVDVTPLKIKDLLYEDENSIVLANKIRWFSHSCRYYDGCDRRFLAAWRSCLDRISKSVRNHCRGPQNSGIVIWSNIDECPKLKHIKSRGSFMMSQLVSRETATFNFDYPGLLAHRLWELFSGRGEARFYGNAVTSVMSHRMSQSPLFYEGNWYHFGPWETGAR